MSRSLPQTIRLRERSPRECRMGRADVSFLLERHRAHVEVAPTGRRHRYVLTPKGHIGTIVAPHCRLVIRPKLALPNLLKLLDAGEPAVIAEDSTEAVSSTGLFDVLASRLARLLAERAAAGLHRAYREESVRGPFLQGRLDLPAQLRAATGTRDQLHCRREEFTADVPCNQVPRATAELILASPLLGDTARAALQRALSGYESVTPVSLDAEAFADAGPDRLTEAYRPLLELCRLLFESLSPGEATGPVPCPAFLLDLERAFESYCTRRLLAAWGEMGPREWTASVQPWSRVCGALGQPPLAMRPDLTLDRDGRPVLVIDAKWKRLSRAALPTDDVYQVLAYCAALGARGAALIYPGRRNRTWQYRFENSPITLAVHTLNVTGTRAACRAAVGRLARALARRTRDSQAP